jgi:hypothetical protein
MTDLLTFTNEIFTAAIVIVAASLLLYNLVRNVRDRVTRASAVLLGCVTVAYIADSIAGLEPDDSTLEAWYRLQWIGIAFTPAAMFQLAHALLSTTGRVSRGRRRRTVRFLYVLSTLILILAAFTDTIVGELEKQPVTYLKAGSLFWLYAAYFAVACFVSIRLVWRARERCLTTATRRRMSLLFIAFLTPGLGIFPYSLLFDSFGAGKGIPQVPLLVVFNLANLFVILMLVFLSYPLSFFGTDKPDRIIKTELLQFLLRGPLTANILLAALVSAWRLSHALGLKREDFAIVSVVAIVLFMQWSITLLLPRLEDWFIYTHDQTEARQLRQLSDRLLTRADSRQLQEAILAAVCDQLQSPAAFIASIQPEKATLEQMVGTIPDEESLRAIDTDLSELHKPEELQHHQGIYLWRSFWLLPLYSTDLADESSVIGIIGIWAPKPIPDLREDEAEVLRRLCNRAAKVLSDQHLQAQLFSTLDELVSDIDDMRQLGNITRYGHIQAEVPNGSETFEWVRAALRDFWGGPKLADNQLIQLRIVQREQERNHSSPTRALQAVLTQAIESLRPEGERSMTTTEWILYNILEMRFLQGKKVRDVARQLAMSEPDFYRKQRIAIEEVARRISEMEQEQADSEGLQDTPDLATIPTP